MDLIDLAQLPRTFQTLNSLNTWGGKIEFGSKYPLSLKFSGEWLFATVKTPAGIATIAWPSLQYVYSFGKTQAIIGKATRITILSPPYGYVRPHWIFIAGLLIELAEPDIMENPMQDEMLYFLDHAWRLATKPEPPDEDPDRFMGECMHSLKTLVFRDEKAIKIPPCVFIAEGKTWVHAPSLQNWLSIPGFTGRKISLEKIQCDLRSLGFSYHRNLSRPDKKGQRVRLSLWSGPKEILVEPEGN